MDEHNNNVELEQESLEMIDDVNTPMDTDALTKAVEEQMDKIRRQNLMLGAQAICRVILQKIYEHQAKPGKKSYRDYERLVSDIKKFCETGISRQVNEDGATSTVEENNEEATQ